MPELIILIWFGLGAAFGLAAGVVVGVAAGLAIRKGARG